MKASRTRAFYIETLVLTFMLLAVLSILIQVFGAAGEKSLSAKRKTNAAVIAQNITAEFRAASGAFGEPERQLLESDETADGSDIVSGTQEIILYRDENGVFSEKGQYKVSVLLSKEARPVGSMLTMTAIITYGDSDDVLAAVDSAKYVPDDEAAITLDSGGEIVLDAEEETESESLLEIRELSVETEAQG